MNFSLLDPTTSLNKIQSSNLCKISLKQVVLWSQLCVIRVKLSHAFLITSMMHITCFTQEDHTSLQQLHSMYISVSTKHHSLWQILQNYRVDCVHLQSVISRNGTSWKNKEQNKHRESCSCFFLFYFPSASFLSLTSPFLSPLFFSRPDSSISVFLSPSIQLANGSAGAEEMDGESIFRVREGGQAKSKLGREGEREGGRRREVKRR